MADIFLSYANEDRAKAERLAHGLEAQGWDVWWDRHLGPGVYDEAIQKELTAASCVVVFWSASSIESAWVKDEAQEGADRRVLVPARLEDVKPPLGFRRQHTTDLIGWTGSGDSLALQELLNQIDIVMGVTREPVVSPQVVPDSRWLSALGAAGGGFLVGVLIHVPLFFIENESPGTMQGLLTHPLLWYALPYGVAGALVGGGSDAQGNLKLSRPERVHMGVTLLAWTVALLVIGVPASTDSFAYALQQAEVVAAMAMFFAAVLGWAVRDMLKKDH